MDELALKINDLIVSTFNSILNLENQMIQSLSRNNLTISEVHLIEQVAKLNTNCTISELAAQLNVSLPTVTVAVNRLVNKNCLIKKKNPHDTRSILISLTHKGEKIHQVHLGFHKKLLAHITRDLSCDEQIVLSDAVAKIKEFFENIRRKER